MRGEEITKNPPFDLYGINPTFSIHTQNSPGIWSRQLIKAPISCKCYNSNATLIRRGWPSDHRPLYAHTITLWWWVTFFSQIHTQSNPDIWSRPLIKATIITCICHCTHISWVIRRKPPIKQLAKYQSYDQSEVMGCFLQPYPRSWNPKKGPDF